MKLKNDLLDLEGIFTFQTIECRWHIQTNQGCFEWFDARFPGGNNALVPVSTYSEWSKNMRGIGNPKGKHIVGKFCNGKQRK